MFIRAIVIEGVDGDVKVTHTDEGATVSVERFSRRQGKHDVEIARIDRRESREAIYAKTYEVAKVVMGTDRQGRPLGTNSMIHEVMSEIERVAGC